MAKGLASGIGSHIIPRFYLDRFADPPDREDGQKQIWVYEKGRKPRYTATVVQGFQNGYFAFTKDDGTLDESLETRLAELEGNCLETLELTATQFFDIQSASRRNDLAFYASMLFCRAKQRRNRSEKTYANLRQQFVDLLADEEWLDRVTAHYVERTGDTIRPKVLKDRIAIFAERMNDTKELRNSFVEDLIQTTEILKNVALQKPWQLLRAPKGAEFVTSDNPFITFIDLGNGRLNSGHGLRKKETIGVFPIAPQVCLVMGTEGPDEVTTDAASVTLINNTIIELCERYVYSKTLSEGVRQVVDKMANERKYGVNAFVPLGIKVPTAKDFVLHFLKLAPWPFPNWITQTR
jgi:hypothetical protein